jgi:hypothetical protein
MSAGDAPEQPMQLSFWFIVGPSRQLLIARAAGVPFPGHRVRAKYF